MIVIKSKKEIERIRRSGTLAADVLLYAASLIKEGVTTLEINASAAQMITERGGKSACLGYRDFPKEICVSVNNEICHGIPSKRKLINGDVVKVDITTILDGCFGDTAATYIVGHGTKVSYDLLLTTQQCLMIGLSQIRSGVKTGKIGYKINQFATSKGYSVVYDYAGHGCGLEFHEEPSIMHVCPEASGVTMRPGMTFTVEPMINIGRPAATVGHDGWTALTMDGSLSAQFEHTVVVTENGYEILTMPSSGDAFGI